MTKVKEELAKELLERYGAQAPKVARRLTRLVRNRRPRSETQGQAPKCVVNGVLIFISDAETGSYRPSSDPEGLKRPYILARCNASIADLAVEANQVREAYDRDRELDGYPPFKWDRDEAMLSDVGVIQGEAVPQGLTLEDLCFLRDFRAASRESQDLVRALASGEVSLNEAKEFMAEVAGSAPTAKASAE